MSTKAPKTFDEVRAAFESRSILNASRTELEELLAAAACVRSEEEATRAQLREMGQAMRQLLVSRRGAELRRPSTMAIIALLLMAAALFWCGGQLYYTRSQGAESVTSQELASEYPAQHVSEEVDHRTTATIAELAMHAPSLRTGTVQAWWAGQQAREVQRLEALAKRQTLAGDLDGAARTVSRADEIRSGIPALADFERPPAR